MSTLPTPCLPLVADSDQNILQLQPGQQFCQPKVVTTDKAKADKDADAAQRKAAVQANMNIALGRGVSGGSRRKRTRRCKRRHSKRRHSKRRRTFRRNN